MREVITLETPSLGDRTYLVHDGCAALVVDPQRDTDRLVAAAEAAGVAITHVVETHVHNDYVSGGLALVRVTGARYMHAAAEALPFDHQPIRGGDRFTVGTLSVEVVHTPGHTAHHLSYIVRADALPPAAFTGGSLLYGTVGRTDLVDAGRTDELTRQQFRTVNELAAALPDDTEIYPTHGFGSFCASAKSDDDSDGTLGTERQVNLALTIDDENRFVERLVSGLTAYPAYYAHMGHLNRSGAFVPDLSPAAPVDPVELARRIHRGDWVVDLRQRRVFAADHLTGTVGIELADPFSTYLGWLIPWGTPLTLLADAAEDIAEAQRQLVRIGIDRPAGAASGGMDTWGSGASRRSYRAVDFRELATTPEPADRLVLDVRRDDEWADGHIHASVHIPLDQLLGRLPEVPETELWVHCATGFRASIAASLLDRTGRSVVLIDDDFANAERAGLEIIQGVPGARNAGTDDTRPSGRHNIDVVRGIYEGFDRNDLGPLLAALEAQVEWHEAEHVTFWPGGPFVGPDAVLSGLFARIPATFSSWGVDIGHLTASENVVLVEGRYRGRAVATGRDLAPQFAHVWELRDEKVVRFQQYTDTWLFAEVTGVAPTTLGTEQGDGP